MKRGVVGIMEISSVAERLSRKSVGRECEDWAGWGGLVALSDFEFWVLIGGAAA